MNFDEVMRLIGRWAGTLKFFPGEADARIGIAEEIVEMCRDVDQVRWLVRRTAQLHREWPGTREVRAVFCSKFIPKDGIDVGSEVYVDGIPAEAEAAPLAIAGPPRDQKRLEGPVSAAPSLAATVADLKQATSLKRELLRLRRQRVRDIPEVRVTDVNRITQADIDRAVEKLRQSRAEKEVLGITDADVAAFATGGPDGNQ